MDELRAELLRRVANGAGIRATARTLGVISSTALNWVQKAGGTDALRCGLPDQERPVAEQKADAATGRVATLQAQMGRLRDELGVARARAKSSEREEETAERVRTEILGLAAATPAPPNWVLSAPTGGSAPGVPVAFWSDWHWGERVRKAEAGGVNEYDGAIARERVKRLVETTSDLAYNHMVNPTYPGAVVILGGDMVSGDIHEELARSNEVTTIQQVVELADVLVWALLAMANRFGRLFVPCVVGNHGRNTLKPRMKGRTFTNYDWLLYCMLERALAHDDRIQFMIPEGTDCLFRVYGHRFLLTHGDALGAKGGDGIIGALGPIMRGRVKLKNSESQIGRDFDTLLMGHYHQYITLPGLVVNGSLKGYDEFARLALRAPYQRPTQALFFVHRKHGLTAHWPVFLEPQPSANGEWISWKD